MPRTQVHHTKTVPVMSLEAEKSLLCFRNGVRQILVLNNADIGQSYISFGQSDTTDMDEKSAPGQKS